MARSDWSSPYSLSTGFFGNLLHHSPSVCLAVIEAGSSPRASKLSHQEAEPSVVQHDDIHGSGVIQDAILQVSKKRSRRRSKRRELLCPKHPEQKIFSVSAKYHLYVTEIGQLMLRGLSKRKSDELLAAFNRVLPLTGEWLECFWCEDCQSSSWWHVNRHDQQEYSLSSIPRELWEQASGVIRAEGNPTVSDFSRRQARATGVTGLRQYRFL